MNPNKFHSAAKRALVIAGITIAATTGCSKKKDHEISQQDERKEMVTETRRSINEEVEETPMGGVLEARPTVLTRSLVERARTEKKLNLPRNVNDIGPLTGVPIEEIEMDWTGRVGRLKDLSPLKGAPLKKINISYTLVEDIEALRDLPLEEVDISNNNISDLSPLKGKNIKILRINGSPIKSLEPLRGMPLEVFELGSNNPVYRPEVDDFSALQDCPLKEVFLSQIHISDIAVLKGKPIEVLHLDSTDVSELSALRGMPLRELSIAWSQVKDLEPLRGMKLKRLTLYATHVTDLSPIADMPLEHLDLGDDVTDLRPIKDLLERLKKTDDLMFFSMSKEIDWNTYQLVEKKDKSY